MTNIQDEYEKAMAVLDDLAKDYLLWVQEDLKKLHQVYSQALLLQGDRRTNLITQDLFRIVHDIKGQGSTFGYDLVTCIGNHLCRYIERFDTFDKKQMQDIKMHIDVLQEIVEKKLVNDGGVLGQDLKIKIEAL